MNSFDPKCPNQNAKPKMPANPYFKYLVANQIEDKSCFIRVIDGQDSLLHLWTVPDPQHRKAPLRLQGDDVRLWDLHIRDQTVSRKN